MPPKHPLGRYMVGLFLIAALAVASTVVTYRALSRQEADSLVLQVASTQGQLARRLASLAEDAGAAGAAPISAVEMRSIMDRLEAGQHGLQFGDPALGLPDDSSVAIDQLFIAVADPFQVVRARGAEIVADLEVGRPVSPAVVADLSAAAELYDTTMASVVFQYQVEAEHRVQDLKVTQYFLLSGTLVVLLLVGLFLFRPAVRELRKRAELGPGQDRELDAEQLSYLARYDPLTGLINRTLFADRLQGAVARSRRDGGLVALMFLDVDNFKDVNDGFGHATGDVVLRQIAQRLRWSVRESDTVARLGGDEFTVILEGGHRVEDAGRVATKILTSVTAPYQVGGQELRITASIGIAMYPVDGEDADELLRAADIAMYSAKAAGKNTYQYFTRELRERATERQRMIDDLRIALEDGHELDLVYQPMVDMASGAAVSVEALLRWRHPTLGDIEPSRFIPLAEETDLIIPMGEWVLYRACSQMEAWRKEGLSNVAISVNVSSGQYRLGNLVETVAASLAATGLPARFLWLEMTEASLLSEVELARRTLERLNDLGVRVVIDDFGSGHSSLRDLDALPISLLKIDRSFVAGMGNAGGADAVPAAIIGLARSLDIAVSGAGVETTDQVNALRRLGCKWMQGHNICKPLEGNEVLPYLRQIERTSPALEAG
jgi:diguanylate cyclase (GGDEF)-like protein